MYHFLSLLSGILVAVMVFINGGLTQVYGLLLATVIVHIVGVVFSFLLCRVKGLSLKLPSKLPLWLYAGGAIGFFSTVSNNFSFGRISMTSIVALGLLGQTATSVAIDALGLFGMERRPLRPSAAAGLLFSVLGILVMLDGGGSAAAVAVAIGGGVTVVLSRTVNARLSAHMGALPCSFVNHMVGLFVSMAVALPVLLSAGVTVAPGAGVPWIYLGGTLGVTVVALFNLIVPRVSAFHLTLLSFVGQVFTGVAIDLLTQAGFSSATFAGGLLVAAGVVVNLVWEHLAQRGAH